MQNVCAITTVGTVLKIIYKNLAPVVQTLDSAIHWINHYPLDNSIGFASVYPLDSDLSAGQRYPLFEQLGPDIKQVALRKKNFHGQQPCSQGSFPSLRGSEGTLHRRNYSQCKYAKPDKMVLFCVLFFILGKSANGSYPSPATSDRCKALSNYKPGNKSLILII